MPDVDSDTKRTALVVGLATIALGFLGGFVFGLVRPHRVPPPAPAPE